MSNLIQAQNKQEISDKSNLDLSKNSNLVTFSEFQLFNFTKLIRKSDDVIIKALLEIENERKYALKNLAECPVNNELSIKVYLALKIGARLQMSAKNVLSFFKKYYFYRIIDNDYKITDLGQILLLICEKNVYNPKDFLFFQKFLRLESSETGMIYNSLDTELMVSMKKLGLVRSRHFGGNRSTTWTFEQKTKDYQSLLLSLVQLSENINIDSFERNCINYAMKIMTLENNVYVSISKFAIKRDLFLSQIQTNKIIELLILLDLAKWYEEEKKITLFLSKKGVEYVQN